MPDLFDHAAESRDPHLKPLADRLRPTSLNEVVGQGHLLGAGCPLAEMVAAGRISSLILWGPPGVGKTTIARLLAGATDLAFEQLSAIFTGVADLRRVFDAARMRSASGRGTLLFVDEIHRFNKAQQDSFLPHMEDGTIVLLGATTENPSFELNGALLSRAQVLILRALDPAALERLLAKAEEVRGPLPLTADARVSLVAMAAGDGRALLNLVEQLPATLDAPLDARALALRLTRRAPNHDKSGDGHFNLISALHKSVRASDPDAALYWLARLVDAGEDPLYAARRMIRMASEDIGLADPDALGIALAARETFVLLGSPEGELALAEAAVYLALAPKSNAVYRAWGSAQERAGQTPSLSPPLHSLNAPTRVMREAGYAEGYDYDHDAPDGFSGQSHLPEEIAGEEFYAPVARGFERELAERVERFRAARAGRRLRDGRGL